MDSSGSVLTGRTIAWSSNTVTLATVNFRLAAPEFEYILNDSSPRVLVFEAQYAEVVASLRPRLKSVETYVCIGGKFDWAVDYESYLASGDAAGA